MGGGEERNKKHFAAAVRSKIREKGRNVVVLLAGVLVGSFGFIFRYEYGSTGVLHTRHKKARRRR